MNYGNNHEQCLLELCRGALLLVVAYRSLMATILYAEGIGPRPEGGEDAVDCATAA